MKNTTEGLKVFEESLKKLKKEFLENPLMNTETKGLVKDSIDDVIEYTIYQIEDLDDVDNEEDIEDFIEEMFGEDDEYGDNE